MKSMHRSRKAVAATTLAEVLIAMVVSMFMFIAILTGTIALNQIFSGAMNYCSGTTDQQRAMDYIARDLRRALTVTVSQNNQTLTVTVPDCYSSYDSQGNPNSALVAPTITSGAVNYGNPAKPLTICYYVSNGQLLRQQTIGATGASSTLVIANSVQDLTSTFQNLTSIVTFNVSFLPTMTTHDRNQAATTLTASTSIRNALR